MSNSNEEEEEEIEDRGAVAFDQTTIGYKLCRVIARSTTGQIGAEVSSNDPHLLSVFAQGLTVPLDLPAHLERIPPELEGIRYLERRRSRYLPFFFLNIVCFLIEWESGWFKQS